MKIKDIIKLDKKIAIEVKKSFGTYFYENKTKLKYQEKNGYYWKIPCHSSFESLLLNNYEKDCVIAYVENPYFVMGIMKGRGKDNYKVFRFHKKEFHYLFEGYTLDFIYNLKKFLEVSKIEKVNVCDEIEFQRFKKLIILEELQN